MSAGAPLIALQLYTVRELLARDPEAALERTAAAGFRHVEWFGGFFDRPASAWRQVLDRLGLRLLALHVDWDTLRRGGEGADLSRLVADCRALDCPTVVCPFVPPAARGDAAAWQQVGSLLDRAAYQLRAASLRLLYHNHDFDLGPPGAELTPLEHVLGAASLPVFGAELDVFWAAWAGWDPVALLRRLRTTPGGVALVHLKDGLLPEPAVRAAMPYASVPFRPLGQGDLDLPRIVAAARDQGVSGFVVEQDFCDGDPFAAAAASLAYLTMLPQLQA